MSSAVRLQQYIRAIPDFPKPGIVFRDITPLLAAPDALREAIQRMGQPFVDQGITKIAAAEARGFLFGVAMAIDLNVGFVPVRKPGKLPHETIEASYELEYGTDTLEIHADAFREGDRVLIVDDLLATGGTLAACVDLVRRTGAEVAGCSCLIELPDLDGRSKLDGVDVTCLMSY